MKVTTVYPQETLDRLKAVDDAICTIMKNLIPQELFEEPTASSIREFERVKKDIEEAIKPLNELKYKIMSESSITYVVDLGGN